MALTTLMHFGVYCLNQPSVLSSGLPSQVLPQAPLGAGNIIRFPASGVAVSVQTAPCCDRILETFFLSLVSELCWVCWSRFVRSGCILPFTLVKTRLEKIHKTVQDSLSHLLWLGSFYDTPAPPWQKRSEVSFVLWIPVDCREPGRRCFVQEKKTVYVFVHHKHSDSEEALHWL